MLRRSGHENPHLQKAWGKHGREAFSFFVLLYCDKDSLLFYEQRTLDIFARDYGWRRLYNCLPVAGSRLGSKVSEENRRKMRERMLGKQYGLGIKWSDERRAQMSERVRGEGNPRFGQHCSDETKAKIAAANRGRKLSPEIRAKISAAGKGRKLNDKQRATLAASSKMKGKKHSAEARLKMSKAQKGRTFSDECRKKISEGVRAAIARGRKPQTHCRKGHPYAIYGIQRKTGPWQCCSICWEANRQAGNIRRKLKLKATREARIFQYQLFKDQDEN